ncbi:hypothetical protein POM88_014689 [Heracleum sosnowskyi]|uniref:Uncharacterized protein n=1 Tax=Heracleum sosnowskyi TaxID=360622 RepID=A0AAD8IJ45_9APIA|nr:hypothetical protein POM88_014689 [Heracleum sosnowskyi]
MRHVLGTPQYQNQNSTIQSLLQQQKQDGKSFSSAPNNSTTTIVNTSHTKVGDAKTHNSYLDDEVDHWYQIVQADYTGLGWEPFTKLVLRRFFTCNQVGPTTTPLSAPDKDHTKPSDSGFFNLRNPVVKRISASEMAKRREKGLCYNCDEVYTFVHKCSKHQLFPMVGDVDDEVCLEPDSNTDQSTEAEPLIDEYETCTL